MFGPSAPENRPLLSYFLKEEDATEARLCQCYDVLPVQAEVPYLKEFWDAISGF